MVVWSLCDYTTVMLTPWARAGHKCLAVDTRHPPGVSYADGIARIGGDLLDICATRTAMVWGDPDFVFAFSPCTHLAVSGARWFASKGLPPLIDSLRLVQRCVELCSLARRGWMIENPVARLSTCWRKPDHMFDPCDYGGYLTPSGDAYTKRTCLWVGGGFVMPAPKRVEPLEGSRMHLLPPSADCGHLRSVTPSGFAEAVYQANCHTTPVHTHAEKGELCHL
jgi:hypothetical protein